ncbi:MAG: hypothetical protein DMF88_05160 [Acidobacteria bacterium]|nr:MAG: hypothetical protein DMF88_05160 [Acidobacteriota bacterium]
MTRTLTAALVAVLTAGAAYAHHSYGAYYENQTITIEGTLETIRFANPHVIMTLRTEAQQLYTLEWQNLVQLRHGNVGPTTLKAGDRIVVIGSPPRDPSSHMITLLREISRPSDGWRWRRTTRQ